MTKLFAKKIALLPFFSFFSAKKYVDCVKCAVSAPLQGHDAPLAMAADEEEEHGEQHEGEVNHFGA